MPSPSRYWGAHRRRKISIRGAANLRLAEFVVHGAGDAARVFVNGQHLIGALERRPVDSAAHHQLHALVVRAKAQDFFFNSRAVFVRAEAQINFGGRFGGYHI